MLKKCVVLLITFVLALSPNCTAEQIKPILIVTQLDSQTVQSISSALDTLFTSAGYNVQKMNATEFNNASLSNYSNVIILPVADQNWSVDQINNYLHNGGNIVLTGNAGRKISSACGLPIYNDYELYQMPQITQVSDNNKSMIKENINITGSFSGMSAYGYRYPGASGYMPILDARDKYGRVTGRACGLLSHYSGPYSGGDWLFFGIDNAEFYAKSEVISLIADVVQRSFTGEFRAAFSNARENTYQAAINFNDIFPPPQGRISLLTDGKSLIYPDGRQFYMNAANYAGPVGMGFGLGGIGDRTLDMSALEEDFKKASEIGINTFRLWSVNAAATKTNQIIKYLARKYGIYLIIQLNAANYSTDTAMLNYIKPIVNVYANEPMVIGYDMCNEPFIEGIGAMTFDGSPSPVMQLQAYNTYSSWFPMATVDKLASTNSYPSCPSFTDLATRKQLKAASYIWEKIITYEYTNSKQDFSTLTGYNGTFGAPSGFEPVLQSIEQTFSMWITKCKTAIKTIDNNALVTIGYNSAYALLDANSDLDFFYHHTYQDPHNYAEHMKNLTMFERLQLHSPQKPIALGEFGYTSGEVINSDNQIMDVNTQALGEFMFYLYSYTKGYLGASIWMLNERPVANMKFNETWVTNPTSREERFGMFYPDGNKPLVYAMKGFKKYKDQYPQGRGNLEIVQSNSRIGAGYTFRDDGVLFVGDVSYNTPELSFSSPVATNVMIMYAGDELELTATSDVAATIDPAYFIDNKTGLWNIAGMHDGYTVANDKHHINLLKGETVTFTKPKLDIRFFRDNMPLTSLSAGNVVVQTDIESSFRREVELIFAIKNGNGKLLHCEIKKFTLNSDAQHETFQIKIPPIIEANTKLSVYLWDSNLTPITDYLTYNLN